MCSFPFSLPSRKGSAKQTLRVVIARSVFEGRGSVRWTRLDFCSFSLSISEFACYARSLRYFVIGGLFAFAAASAFGRCLLNNCACLSIGTWPTSVFWAMMTECKVNKMRAGGFERGVGSRRLYVPTLKSEVNLGSLEGYITPSTSISCVLLMEETFLRPRTNLRRPLKSDSVKRSKHGRK